MSGAAAQLGVASLIVTLLMWLLIRSLNENTQLRKDHEEERRVFAAELAAKNDKLLAQHAELSERLLQQAVETAPLLREALDLLRQTAVMFEAARQSPNGRP